MELPERKRLKIEEKPGGARPLAVWGRAKVEDSPCPQQESPVPMCTEVERSWWQVWSTEL